MNQSKSHAEIFSRSNQMLVFDERGKPQYRRKKPLGAEERAKKLNPHVMNRGRALYPLHAHALAPLPNTIRSSRSYNQDLLRDR